MAMEEIVDCVPITPTTLAKVGGNILKGLKECPGYAKFVKEIQLLIIVIGRTEVVNYTKINILTLLNIKYICFMHKQLGRTSEV